MFETAVVEAKLELAQLETVDVGFSSFLLASRLWLEVTSGLR